jgi:hypothetical protein
MLLSISKILLIIEWTQWLNMVVRLGDMSLQILFIQLIILVLCVLRGDVSDEQGVLDVDVPEGVYDTRNLLTLGGLIAVISRTHTLLSNDSAPVHLAGAFNNYIILIPTCKHPDHVLPYRHGHRYHKSYSIYKKLLCAAFDSVPTKVHGQTIDHIIGDIMDYLPEPIDVQKLVNFTFL